MNSSLSVALGLLGGFLLASGCASPAIQRVSPADIQEEASYFLMKLTFVNQDPIIHEEGCRLKFFSAEGGEPQEIHVSVSDRWVMVPLTPGIYSLREIYCHTDAQWTGLSIGSSSPIRITERAINLWGSVSMNVSSSGQLNISFQSQDQVKTDLKEWFSQEGRGVAHRTRSASNGKVISEKMVTSKEGPSGVTYSFQKGAKQPPDFKPLPIENCVRSGVEQNNPIRVGSLAIFARYEKGKAPQIRRDQDENTFSPEIAECVENLLKTFKWTGPGWVEARFKM